ncbi:family 78 glycoside hydrolase catalytic domain [Plantactinospora solaniradicis]|uniref:alpha-L-rhamnosidase n=1 Tax=Plantactinospora solaniradicis TaxID=1723736 RepID=A0ABW1K3Y7_9ACTN
MSLSVERAVDPIGIDEPRPLLGWQLPATARGRAQTAYQIVVTDDADAVVWDSGTVASADSVDVPYGGPTPRPRTRYHWRVRIIDERVEPSAWSEPATWESGLMRPGEWTAGWISSAAEAAAPVRIDLDTRAPFENIGRIWAAGTPTPTEVLFRTEFTVPPGRAVTGARLTTGGAAEITAWLNGVPVHDADPRPAVRVGRNVLALRAVAGALPGGLVARLTVSLADLPPVLVVADDRWWAAAAPIQTRQAGPDERAGSGEWAGPDEQVGPDEQAGSGEAAPDWARPDHDDSGWAKAVALGPHGNPPWGREPATHRTSPYLRRAFEVAAPVRRARLYATAAGLYELTINGTPVGDHRLAPGWTDYQRRVPYQSYDVTALLRPGRNALAATLADGWYAGQVGFLGAGHYGDVRALRAELHLDLDDGTHTVLGTDGRWRTGEGGLRYADLQNGEVYDARREPAGWREPDFDDTGWPAAVPVPGPAGEPQAQIAEPIRALHELPARTVTELRPGTVIADFGQNVAGWVRLRLRGPAGQRVMLRHAEVRGPDGELYLTALRTARATDEYVLRGDPDGEEYEPRFTVHGFRYCEVSGLSGPLDGTDVTAVVAYADMPATGRFACSSEPLNRLQANIVWSQRGNFLTVPTDCPQRDERLGWTGDAQVFAATAAFNYDVRSFLRKWLQDVRDAQRPDGAIAHVAPDVMTGAQVDNPTRWAGSGGWGDAVAIVPERLLTAYADRRAVTESLDAMDGWLRYLDRRGGGDQPDGGYADWLAVTPTPKELVNAAYFAYTARLAARLAESVADPRAGDWHALADRLRAEFQARYVGGGGRVSSGTQTAYVLALHADLLPAADRPAAVDRLVAEVAARHDHLTTGFLGTPWLLDALTDGGRVDVAYRLLTQQGYPSWLYPVVHGDATTIWERWDSWSDSRGFQNPHMTSFNHYAYGAVGDWLYRTVAGLAPTAPGYRTIRIRPRPGGGLASAEAELATVQGRAAVAWRDEAGTFVLDVTVPPNTTAEVWVPDADPADVTEGGTPASDADGVRASHRADDGSAVFTVGSGTYRFRRG